MAKATFRWVIKSGEIMNFRALGVIYGKEVRFDQDEKPDAAPNGGRARSKRSSRPRL